MNTLKFTLLCITLFAVACQSTPSTQTTQTKETIPPILTPEMNFESYDFEIKGFGWDPNPFKFSAYIQDSVFQEKGAQFAAFDFSYIGNIQGALTTWDDGEEAPDPLTKEEIATFENYHASNARDYILAKAKNHQVTIINEAHHVPQHRVFTTRLLKDLYQQGYRHLGLEALLNARISDSLLLANKHPVLTNGIYMKEPQFGNMVREAIKIGYKIFPYESSGHSDGKGREINQAKNIQNYMEKYPKDKILIHCGFAHAMEGDLGNKWEKSMAGRLTEYTGTDPLSINQYYYSERSNRTLENPYYQSVDVTEASVFVNDKDEVFGKYKEGAWYDISIFHPRTQNFNRPEWLLFGNRKVVSIDLTKVPFTGPFQILAYLKGEEIGKAIPYDIYETSSRNIKLVLEPGDYNLVVRNEIGKSVLLDYKVD